MNSKKFSQEEVNCIVAVRIKRERERLTKDFVSKMKRCMALVHLRLHQELWAMEQDIADDGGDKPQ